MARSALPVATKNGKEIRALHRQRAESTLAIVFFQGNRSSADSILNLTVKCAKQNETLLPKVAPSNLDTMA